VIAGLRGTTSKALMEEMREQERQGKPVMGASKSQLQYWRTSLRAKDTWRWLGVVYNNWCGVDIRQSGHA
jgi:hypothetical protein